MNDPKARPRALLIMQVQAGVMSATEAARQLGISRKTYYQWEARALRGLLEAVTQRPPGRPRRAIRPQERQLQRKVGRLQKALDQAEQSRAIRAALNRVRQAMDAKKTPHIDHLLTMSEALQAKLGRSARALCRGLALPYRSFLRWRARRRQGAPLAQRPGPKKIHPLPLAQLEARVAQLTHGHHCTFQPPFTSRKEAC